METTIVSAIKCPECKDMVFSRARHDYRTCSCGEISIDGGFDYTKISFKKIQPEIHQITISATRQEIFNDWNLRKNKLGLIKSKE